MTAVRVRWVLDAAAPPFCMWWRAEDEPVRVVAGKRKRRRGLAAHACSHVGSIAYEVCTRCGSDGSEPDIVLGRRERRRREKLRRRARDRDVASAVASLGLTHRACRWLCRNTDARWMALDFGRRPGWWSTPEGRAAWTAADRERKQGARREVAACARGVLGILRRAAVVALSAVARQQGNQPSGLTPRRTEA